MTSSPQSIYVHYDSVLDLEKIHQSVCARIEALTKALPLLKVKMKRLEACNERDSMTLVEKRELNVEKEKLGHIILSLESGKALDVYEQTAEPLLKAYHETQVPEVKKIIIKAFLDVVSLFVSVHASMAPVKTTSCHVCGTHNEKQVHEFSDPNVSDGCKTCGQEFVGVVFGGACFREKMRIDVGNRSSYDDLMTFIKRMDAYEGHQKKKPNPSLYVQLDEYFAKTRLAPTSQEAKSLPLEEDGKKKGTSMILLGEALLKTKNGAYYKDIEYIAHVLWGWKLADITSNGLRQIMILDYITTQVLYNEIKERDSSLNSNLRLYFHLVIRGYPCKVTDFKILSCVKSIKYHNSCFEQMAEYLGLKFPPIPVN